MKKENLGWDKMGERTCDCLSCFTGVVTRTKVGEHHGQIGRGDLVRPDPNSCGPDDMGRNSCGKRLAVNSDNRIKNWIAKFLIQL